jgi:Tfp pilus assembly protein PilZ
VLAYAGIILFKKVAYFQKQRKELQVKEFEFINKLVAGEGLQPDQSFQMGDFIEDHTIDEDVSKLNKKDNGLGINEVRAFIFEKINRLSEQKVRQLLKDLEEGQKIERRKYDRKNFMRIIDYTVGDRYYRDFIQDLSVNGVFIKTSQKFAVGQTILMTFMSPEHDSPFKINGEIIRVHTDGIGVKFKIESQVQESVLKGFVDMIQS